MPACYNDDDEDELSNEPVSDNESDSDSENEQSNPRVLGTEDDLDAQRELEAKGSDVEDDEAMSHCRGNERYRLLQDRNRRRLADLDTRLISESLNQKASHREGLRNAANAKEYDQPGLPQFKKKNAGGRYKVMDFVNQFPKQLDLVHSREDEDVLLLRIWDWYFPEECWERIVDSTNEKLDRMRNRARKPGQVGRRYKDTHASEMKLFIAICAIMSSMNVNPGMVWNKQDRFWYQQEVAQLMSRDRFETLRQCVSFSGMKDEQEGDDFWRVRWLNELLNLKSLTLWIAGEHIALDEFMSAFAGRFRHIWLSRGAKPVAAGVRSYSVCDKSAFVIFFVLGCLFQEETVEQYSMMSEDENQNLSDTTKIVLHLIEAIRCVDAPTEEEQEIREDIVEDTEWRRVTIDNYYCSVELLCQLWKREVMACGTLRSNRVGVAFSDLKQLMVGGSRSNAFQRSRGDYGVQVWTLDKQGNLDRNLGARLWEYEEGMPPDLAEADFRNVDTRPDPISITDKTRWLKVVLCLMLQRESGQGFLVCVAWCDMKAEKAPVYLLSSCDRPGSHISVQRAYNRSQTANKDMPSQSLLAGKRPACFNNYNQ
eukprot:GFYU01018088.1.p1 GENE.GFYU01018088.1~~GFYU01018088.1.p1  ORF type:complete len:609 (+),score=56.95 GFYU01018088.1:42-1829(+)